MNTLYYKVDTLEWRPDPLAGYPKGAAKGQVRNTKGKAHGKGFLKGALPIVRETIEDV